MWIEGIVDEVLMMRREETVKRIDDGLILSISIERKDGLGEVMNRDPGRVL